MVTRRLLLNLSKAMLELSLLTRDHFVKWQDDKESSQVKVRQWNSILTNVHCCRPQWATSWRPFCIVQCCRVRTAIG